MSYESAPGMPTEDHGAPPPAAAKPGSVALAEKLMYGGAAVTLISGLIGAFGDQDAARESAREALEAAGEAVDEATLDAAMQLGMVTGIIFAVIGAALWALMGWLNGKGIGWARIVATVLGVLGVLLTVVGLFGSALLPGATAGGALAMVLSLVTGALALAVVVLLWRPDASAFFAARKRR
jgi:hypothetical protein